MRKKRERVLVLLMVLLLALQAFPLSVSAAEPTEGSCGKNAQWSVDTEKGILTISGAGKISNYVGDNSYNQPWRPYIENIEKIIVEEGITELGKECFASIPATSCKLPSTLTKIGQGAFRYCSLTSVKIPDNVTDIGRSAFIFNEIQSLKLGNSIKNIGQKAFMHNNIEKLDVPSSVQTIGEDAFRWNYMLTSLTLQEGVTTIDQYAFFDTGIKSVKLPNSLSKIGSYALGFQFNGEDTPTPVTAFTLQGGAAAEAYAKATGLMLKHVKKTSPAVSFSSVKNAKGKKAVLKWKKKNVTGYEIEYAENNKFEDSETILLSKKTAVSKTISGLSKKKTYCFRIRSYTVKSGVKYVSAWSKTKNVKIIK